MNDIMDLYRDTPLYPNQKITVTVPIPPSVNHMYYGKSKRLTADAKKWFEIARTNCIEEKFKQEWKDDRKHVWYYADILLYMPDRRIRDSHNCLKILMDAVQGILFKNDYYCMPRIQDVLYDKDNPRLVITLTPKEVV